MGISDIQASVDDYARGKTWYWYMPLWFFGAYIFFALLQFDMVAGNMPGVLLIPYSFDFFMHEMAHIVTSFLPAVLTAAAGSGSELLLGTGPIVMALWQRSYFAVLFCALWFALACQSAGQYMADAVAQQLPLVSLGAALSGGEPKHDWHFIFGQLGLLPQSGFIGGSLRFVGMLVASFALLFTAWVIYRMSLAPRWKADQQLAEPEAPSLSVDYDKIFTPKRPHPTDSDTPPPGARDSFS